MTTGKNNASNPPVSVWRAVATSLRRFARERTPGWSGTSDTQSPSSREIGDRGEKVARWHLQKQGYHILATNWWAPNRRGELDIVTMQDETLVGIEVKSYPAGELSPAEALDRQKRRKLVRLIKTYARQERLLHCNMRVDLLVVEWAEGGQVGSIRHIESAVTEDDA